MNEANRPGPMAEGAKCPQCGTPLETGALAGFCPACLLQQGAHADTATAGQTPPFNAPSPAELAPLFPQIEVLDLVGKGGMGAVYRARQKQLDRVVALKLLPARPDAGPVFAERFNREARALARLNHPNVVAVHDFGTTGGFHYFVMEFVDGVNLRQLERAGRLSPREALQIIPQICDALQYAHDEGVVHRDIKPENVLVDRKGQVKIADFGLAKLLDAPPADAHLTAEGQVMGTPHYMAPEQVEHPLEVDHRADIYSLGVVFYEMLTGELPLGKFAAPSRKVQVDVRLDEVVLHALEKEPARRYQQANEVKTAVETIRGTPAQKVSAAAASRNLWALRFSVGPEFLPDERVLHVKKPIWRSSAKSLPAYRLFFSLPPLFEAGLYVTDRRLLLYAYSWPLLTQEFSIWFREKTREEGGEFLNAVSTGRSRWFGRYLELRSEEATRHWYRSRELRLRFYLRESEALHEVIARAQLAAGERESSAPSAACDPRRPQKAPLQPFLAGVLFLLPPVLFAWFLLLGYRLLGIDLDADIQAFAGLLGLPLSAATGALLAWAAWHVGSALGPAVEAEPPLPPGRWSWQAIVAGALLVISLPLGGGTMVALQLISRDARWNPGAGEFTVTVSLVGGAILTAASATLLGAEALRRIRRAPGQFRGRWAALAAAFFWPCLLAGLAIGFLPIFGKRGAPPVASVEPPSFQQEEENPFIKRLPQGQIELVAMSYHPSDNQPWWRPDGSPWLEGPFATPLRHEPAFEGARLREFVLRGRGLPADASWPAWKIGNSSGSASDRVTAPGGRQDKELRVIAAALQDPGAQITVRIGVASGPWKTVLEQVPAPSQAEPDAAPDARATRRLLHVSVEFNAPGQEVRAIAVDAKGVEHGAARLGSTGKGAVSQYDAEFILRSAVPITNVLFQVRPREWVEFRNVALEPMNATRNTGSPDLGPGPESAADDTADLRVARARLAELRSRYTEEHPRVQGLLRVIDELERRAKKTPDTAAAESWSPTLAPGEKPDPDKIRQEATDLATQGRYEEALQRHLWYHNHALEYGAGQGAVRLSFALSDWAELARRYPKAKQTLLEIRDRKTREITAGRGYADLFHDVVSINHYLQDEDATHALFKTLHAQDPALAKQCYFYAEDLLVKKGEYALCLSLFPDFQARFDLIRKAREANEKLAQQNPRMNRPEFRRPWENRFVEQSRQLIEILVATGHVSEAENIRDQALAVRGDDRLKSAVAEARKKLGP